MMDNIIFDKDNTRNSMFRNLEKIKTYTYTFGRAKYFIETVELTQDEEKILGEILPSFPHMNLNWPETFAAFNSDNIPPKLLSLAANAYGNNNTMLGIVAEEGRHVEALQRLINMGANVNAIDKDGKLPLHWAIYNQLSFRNVDSLEAVAVVKCLLDNGARTDITCYRNMTLLEYAKYRGCNAAAILIEESIQKKDDIKDEFILEKNFPNPNSLFSPSIQTQNFPARKEENHKMNCILL